MPSLPKLQTTHYYHHHHDTTTPRHRDINHGHKHRAITTHHQRPQPRKKYGPSQRYHHAAALAAYETKEERVSVEANKSLVATATAQQLTSQQLSKASNPYI
jgi:hypothetical protein